MKGVACAVLALAKKKKRKTGLRRGHWWERVVSVQLGQVALLKKTKKHFKSH